MNMQMTTKDDGSWLFDHHRRQRVANDDFCIVKLKL